MASGQRGPPGGSGSGSNANSNNNRDLQRPESESGASTASNTTNLRRNSSSASRNNVLPTTESELADVSDLELSLMLSNPEYYDLFSPDGELAQAQAEALEARGSSAGIPSIAGIGSIGSMMSNPLTYSPQEGFSVERLKSELVRLTTFYTSRSPWPKPFIKPEDCAKAGFYYLGDGDKVQCTFCHGVVGEWEQGDNPMAEHRQHFPRCPFLCGLPVNNVPIGEDELAAATGGGYDICGPFVTLPLPLVRPYAGTDTTPATTTTTPPAQRGAQPIVGDMDDVTNNLAINTGSGPFKKQLATKEARLETFINWPLTCGQCADAMAEAGFYYIGIEDHVKCFYCDGGLKNWELEDDPWAEHAKWFSECPFVKLNKGADFIKNVLATAGPKVPAVPAATTTQLKLPRNGRKFVVTDDNVRGMIDTPLVQDVLRMGLNIGSVKAAIRHQLEHNGTPFINIETMLEAVLYEEEKGLEYYSDFDSDSSSDEDDPVPVMEYDREPRSASSVLAARLTNLVKGSILSKRTQGDENASATTAAGTGPSTSSTGTSQSQNQNQRATSMEMSSEQSSQSGSEDEIMASVSEGSGPPSLCTSTSGSGITSKKCASPSADSGEFSMSNGSDEEAGPSGSVAAKKTKTKSKEKEGSSSGSSSIDEKKARALEEEVRTLREARQCKICMDNDADVVFLPCGHLISCVRCATALSHCALCRQAIKAVVRTYMS